MEGFEVMSALAAAPLGEVFITVTGAPDVLRSEHFELMRDGAVLANAGHFDVEISLARAGGVASGPPREVLPLVDEYGSSTDAGSTSSPRAASSTSPPPPATRRR